MARNPNTNNRGGSFDDATIEAHLNEAARATSFGSLGTGFAVAPALNAGANLVVFVARGSLSIIHVNLVPVEYSFE
jgi:hypothetical protein